MKRKISGSFHQREHSFSCVINPEMNAFINYLLSFSGLETKNKALACVARLVYPEQVLFEKRSFRFLKYLLKKGS
jgi:hypothetical protein